MKSNLTGKLSVTLIAMTGLLLPACLPNAQGLERMSYLDNGEIRLGINLDIGGAITWVSASGSWENLVNSHDWGRQIQMSFYSGPNPYEPNGKAPHPSWTFIGWNPIQSGDCYDNPSQVVAHENDGETLYVKAVPMHWPLDNEPCECTFEVWITLDGPTAKVRARMNNARMDTTQFSARHQELPAVYTNGPYYRLFTYTGAAPFTGDALYRVEKIWDTRIPPAEVPGGPWEGWFATENWAALLNDNDWGLGVWSPGSYQYTGGFAGTPGQGGPKDSPTGYFAPLRTEILDHDIVYEYEYTIILGTLDEIRGFVYDKAPRPAPPHYDFQQNRQGWSLHNARDDGWLLDGTWRVSPTEDSSVLVGPRTLWPTAEAPVATLRAAFDAGITGALVRWQRLGSNGPQAGGEVPLEIIADGKMRDYTVRLADHEGYTGYATQVSLAVQAGTRASGTGPPRVVLEQISLQPE